MGRKRKKKQSQEGKISRDRVSVGGRRKISVSDMGGKEREESASDERKFESDAVCVC